MATPESPKTPVFRVPLKIEFRGTGTFTPPPVKEQPKQEPKSEEKSK